MEYRVISNLKSNQWQKHISKRVIPDLQFSRVLEAATYDPIGPSTNNVAGAVSDFIYFHVTTSTNVYGL